MISDLRRDVGSDEELGEAVGVTSLTIVTMTEIDVPPRDKAKAWARLDELDCFASSAGREVEAEIGSRLNLVACCELGRGGGRSTRDFERCVVEVTGDADDMVTVVAGRKHPYRVQVTGVRPWDGRAATVWEPGDLAGHTRLVLSGNTFDHKERIRELGANWEPDARWWVYAIEDHEAAAEVATELERLGVTVSAA